MSTMVIREKALKPVALPPAPRRPQVVTHAELAPCTCPEHCERDHEND
jgi:hypothetical protein